jgi:hypothetical protein
VTELSRVAHADSQLGNPGPFLRACAEARQQLAAACRVGTATQARLLTELVARHADTHFGREHGFSSIDNMADFRRAVPIRDYDQHASWIERAAAGEPRVLTLDEPAMFLRTSGTTGASKKIPSTRFWRETFRGPAIYAQWGTYLRYHPEILEHPHAVLDLTWDRRLPGDHVASGVPYQSITNRPSSSGPGDWLPPWYHAPWFEVAPADVGYRERLYLKLRHFIEHDLRAIASVNPSTLLVVAEMLKEDASSLIEDVFNGTLGRRVFGPKNAARSRELEAIADRNGGLVPAEVWPGLGLVVCWKSAMAGRYLPQVQEAFPDAEILPFMSTGTEGVVTIAKDRHPEGGMLAVNQAVFEFVPAGDGSAGSVAPDSPTLLPHELEEDQSYLVIMTQGNGLYRYLSGDVYRVFRMARGVPGLEYRGRSNNFCSFTGEKITETQVSDAFREALRERSLRAAQFACCPTWGQPPWYTFVVEPESSWSPDGCAALEQGIDQALQSMNIEYASKRFSERLGSARVRVVARGAFRRWRESMLATGVSPLQLKQVILQKDDSLLRQMGREIA